MIGLETSLGVVMTHLANKVISLRQMVERMHDAPSQLVASRIGGSGLLENDRRPLRIRGSATVVDPNHEWTVDPGKFYSKGRNCPFANWKLKGKAVATIVNGRLVMRDGEVLV